MTNKSATVINQQKCTGCGLCVEVCPDRIITVEDEIAVVTVERCMECGHCLAACPVEAISVASIDPDSFRFASFDINERWLRWGDFDAAELVRLMASQRSCRNYQNKPVSQEILTDLIKIGITAPSGTNSQKWTFTVLDNREQVEKLGNRIAMFFKKINRIATNPLLRFMSRLISGRALDDYYHRYYESVKKGLEVWEKDGRDLLFHGAPAAILVGSAPGASCPAEDALLATQNILLGAHAMGLGTCLIGYAVSVMQHEPAIKALVDIPGEEKIYAVIALGYPAESYQRLTGRRTPVIRFSETL